MVDKSATTMHSKERPTTMVDVVRRFEDIANEATSCGARWGYFAALYGRMTIEMNRRIGNGFFDDRPRMERLDVRFANAYFDALALWRDDPRSPELATSWRIAFDACERDDINVLQHLYLGLTAHLLLDLGVAAARTCPGSEIYSLRRDFNRINDVVGDLIHDFHRALGRASPILGTVDRYLGLPWSSSSLVGLRVARTIAWSAAERLAMVPESAQGPIVREVDARAAAIAHQIANPVIPVAFFARQIRGRESDDPRRIIELLRG